MSESDDECSESEDKDSKGHAWMPVCTDPCSDDYEPNYKYDENVRELDLPRISEKKIFVRKANIKDFKKSI